MHNVIAGAAALSRLPQQIGIKLVKPLAAPPQ